jgi:hypothetical protein
MNLRAVAPQGSRFTCVDFTQQISQPKPPFSPPVQSTTPDVCNAGYTLLDDPEGGFFLAGLQDELWGQSSFASPGPLSEPTAELHGEVQAKAGAQGSAEAQGSADPKNTLPPVLNALHWMNERTRSTAHRLLKECPTIESAFVVMLSATNSGKRSSEERPRVAATLGLMARYREDSPERKTYACMCLINLRCERSLGSIVKYYQGLAAALPDDDIPDELAPYKNVVISRARHAIAYIRAHDFPAPQETQEPSVADPQADKALQVRKAMDEIEEKLNAYESRPTTVAQVTFRHLTQQVEVLVQTLKEKAQGAQGAQAALKRKHKTVIAEGERGAKVMAQTLCDDEPRGQARKQPRLTSQCSNRPMTDRDGHLSHSLVSQPFRHSHFFISAPPTRKSSTVDVVQPAPQSLQTPAPSRWGPASFAGHLKVLAMQNLNPPVQQAIDVIAACANRQDLPRALTSLSPAGFSGLLSLMATFNEAAAGELALYAAVSCIEINEPFPERLVMVVVSALPLVKALPDDVTGTLTLAYQTFHQPSAELKGAMQALFDRLMHGPRK